MSLQLPLVSGEGPSPTHSFLVKGIRSFIYPNREALVAPKEGGPVEGGINATCGKTTDAYLKQVAAAAFRSATAAADEAEAQVDRPRNALQSGIAEQPDVARGAIMDRSATALSGPNARAAILRNPLGAAYHASLENGLSAGIPRDMALLFAGAIQKGVDCGSPSSGDAPNSTVVGRAVRKRLVETAAEKRIAQVARIEGRLGSTGGVISST